MKKILFLLIYFCLTVIIPSIGTQSIFFEPQYVWIQKMILGIFGIFLFRNQLFPDFKKIKLKGIVFVFILSITICLFYVLFAILINKNFNFIHHYHLTFMLTFEAIILTPLIEEFVYRYCLIKLPINEGYNIFLFILSLIIFTFSHSAAAGYSLINLVPFLFMGIVFSTIYIKQKNIWYSVIAHMFYNTIVILLATF